MVSSTRGTKSAASEPWSRVGGLGENESKMRFSGMRHKSYYQEQFSKRHGTTGGALVSGVIPDTTMPGKTTGIGEMSSNLTLLRNKEKRKGNPPPSSELTRNIAEVSDVDSDETLQVYKATKSKRYGCFFLAAITQV